MRKIEGFDSLIKLEKLYAKVFGSDGASKLYLKMWNRGKKDFKEEPSFIQVLWRNSIEEVIFLIVAKKEDERLKNLQELNMAILEGKHLYIDTMENLEKYYEDELKIIRKYWDENPK